MGETGRVLKLLSIEFISVLVQKIYNCITSHIILVKAQIRPIIWNRRFSHLQWLRAPISVALCNNTWCHILSFLTSGSRACHVMNSLNSRIKQLILSLTPFKMLHPPPSCLSYCIPALFTLAKYVGRLINEFRSNIISNSFILRYKSVFRVSPDYRWYSVHLLLVFSQAKLD